MRYNHFLTTWQRGSVLLPLLVLLAMLAACAPRDEPLPTTSTDLPDEQMDGVRIEAMAGDRLEYVLEAVHMDRWKDRQALEADTMMVRTYDAVGNLQATIWSDHASLNEADDILVATSNVVIVNSDGDSLLTHYLVWNRVTDAIWGDREVTVIRQSNTFRGMGFRTDIEFNELVSYDVSGEGTPSDSLGDGL
ncbi:MAG: LPS export ABC transporter periplasmic protein LptC [Candidatus Cloacimonetes bacterium]|nr:LPS export ABC transporter periplasmic protein LptC [Candidatus Cloacimonadota bacterium]